MNRFNYSFILPRICFALLLCKVDASITFFGQDIFPNFQANYQDYYLGPYQNAEAEQELFLSFLANPQVEIFDDYEERSDYTELTINFDSVGDVFLRTGDEGVFGIETTNALGAGRYPVQGPKFLDADARLGGFRLDFENPVAAFGFFGIDLGDFDGIITIQTSLDGENIKGYPLVYDVSAPTLFETISLLEGNVIFFGLIDKDEFDRIEFLTTGSRDTFAFDKFTVASIRQLQLSCKNETLIVGDDCTAAIPPLEEIFNSSNADSARINRLFDVSNGDSVEIDPIPSLLEPGTYTYEVNATFLEGTSIETWDVCTETIQVLDTSPPDVTCFIFVDDANSTCLAGIPPMGDATDNCRVESTAQSPPVGNVVGPGEYSVQFTAVDTSGNQATCEEVYTVVDSTALEVFCIELDDVEADSNCGAIIPNIGTASDNCDSIASTSQIPPVGAFTGLGMSTLTFFASDNEANDQMCSSSFTVFDSTPPEVTCDDDLTVEADEFCKATLPDIGSATDNCEVTGQQRPAPNSDITLGVTSITYIATDSSENAASCSTNIEVVDNTPPEVTCIDDTIERADENCEAVLPDIGTSSDNCGIDKDTQMPAPGMIVNPGEYPLRFTATDGSGNSASCATLFAVVDDTLPEVTCLPDETVPADENCEANVPDIGISSDNCVMTTEVQSPLVSSSVDIGPHEIRFTATDKSGNTATCATVYTVVDETPPEVTCIEDLEQDADNKCQGSIPYIGVADDNCGVESEVQSPGQNEVASIGQTSIRYTVTDKSDNTVSCETVLTVVDNSPPVVTCIANTVLEVDEFCSTRLPDIGSTTDNCAATGEQAPVPNTPVSLGSTSIRYTATDSSDNTASCSTEITVVDSTPPEVTCLPDETVPADENCEANVPDIGISSDNCDATTEVQSPLVSSSVDIGPHEIKFTATDKSGNTATCATVYTVVDETPPEVTCIEDLEQDADNKCQGSIPVIGVADDNCGVESEVQSPGQNEVASIGQTSIRYTVTDKSDNTVSCETVLTVVDNSPPDVTCIANTVLEVDEFCIAGLPDIGSTTDNCAATGEQAPVPNTPVSLGSTSIRYTATDSSDNTASCSTEITVVDSTPPEVTCINDVQQNADANCMGLVPDIGSSRDNCEIVSEDQLPRSGNTVNIGIHSIIFSATDGSNNGATCSTKLTVVDNTVPDVTCIQDIVQDADENCMGEVPDIGMSSDNCGIDTEIQQPLAGSPANVGQSTITYIAVDNSENDDSCSTVLTVVDTTDPDVTCLDDMEIEADQTCKGRVPYIGSSTDNCGVDSEVQEPDIGSMADIGLTKIKYTANDSNNNDASCFSFLRVVDNSSPDVTCIADVILDADENCLGRVPDIGSAIDNCGVDSEVQQPRFGSIAELGDTTIQYTATDDSSNTASCSTLLRVIDNTAPDVNCRDDIVLDADINCKAPVPDIGSSSDSCGIDSESHQPRVGSLVNLGMTTIIYTATDIANNDATCSTKLTVVDNISPDVTCIDDLVIEADEDCKAAIPNIGTSDDNCGIDDEVQIPTMGSTVLAGATSITYTATDGSSNDASCSTLLRVVDTTPPDVTCFDERVRVADENCEAPVPLIAASTDNCVVQSEAQQPNVDSLLGFGDHIITHTATDGSNNVATCTTVFKVVDQTDPQVTCIADIIQDADENCQAEIPSIGVSDDNCGINNEAQVPSVGTITETGLTTITFSAVDNSDNDATCTTAFTVVDSTSPEASCIDDIILEADENCNADVPSIGTSTDNCGVNNEIQDPPIGFSAEVGITSIVYTASDSNNNDASCSTVLRVVDNTIPAVKCLDNIQQVADASCEGRIPSIGDATDNCGVADITQSPPVGTKVGLGDTVIQYTAIDKYGNTASCSTVLNVIGTGALDVRCHPNTELFADENCEATLPDIGFAGGSCGNEVASQEQVPRPGTTIGEGQTDITFTALDTNSNAPYSCTTEVNVIDNIPPVQDDQESICLWPANQKFYCEPVSTLFQGTDNCGIVDIRYLGCQSNPSHDLDCPYCVYHAETDSVCFRSESGFIYTIEANAVDAGGNSGLFSRTIAVPVYDTGNHNGTCEIPLVDLDGQRRELMSGKYGDRKIGKHGEGGKGGNSGKSEKNYGSCGGKGGKGGKGSGKYSKGTDGTDVGKGVVIGGTDGAYVGKGIVPVNTDESYIGKGIVVSKGTGETNTTDVAKGIDTSKGYASRKSKRNKDRRSGKGDKGSSRKRGGKTGKRGRSGSRGKENSGKDSRNRGKDDSRDGSGKDGGYKGDNKRNRGSNKRNGKRTSRERDYGRDKRGKRALLG